MYKCCIFDLDGTLVNSLKAIAHTCNLTLAKYNLGPIEEERYKYLIGEGYKVLVERSLKECGDLELINYEDALITYMDYFKIHCMYEVRPYDKINEMLNIIKLNNIKIGILSNKPHARTIDNVECIFGINYFDIVRGEIEGIKRKPDKEGLDKILSKLNIDKKDCLYVGDTSTDMKTGINAGVDTVGVTWGFRDEEELKSYNPKYIVNSPLEIVDIISKKVLANI